MDNLLMDIQLEEPTIEYAEKKEEVASDVQAPVVEEPKEPFMQIDVPAPTIEMPKKKDEFANDDSFEVYLNYQDYLFAKYGESWSTSLNEEEKTTFIEYYNNSHDDKIMPKTATADYTR